MRIISFILLIFLISSCRKMEIPIPVEPPVSDIFSVKQSEVSNGQEIKFNLKEDGIYTLTIGDSVTNQVITRERFTGKIGENKLNLYTKSLPIKTLYLLLEDKNKNQVGKTIIIIK